ncbi:MAG: zinc ribbon domain-containing protein [Armatimonadota bacterium]|nr:zinc ribbon domain-containing protein [Armatimonadota bacterium]
MPIYEYRCLSCRKRFSKLLGIAERDNPQLCPHCGATNSKRLVSRVARLRTEDQMLDDLADAMEFAGDPDDPQTMRHFLREMSAAMDEDPHEMEELFEEEMAAESSGENGE